MVSSNVYNKPTCFSEQTRFSSLFSVSSEGLQDKQINKLITAKQSIIYQSLTLTVESVESWSARVTVVSSESWFTDAGPGPGIRSA